MKISKIEGYIFLKYHTYISAEAFYNGKSILFCTLPGIGSSHFVFLYSKFIQNYTQQKLNEYEKINSINGKDITVLEALNLKLKQCLINYDYVVVESINREILKIFTDLYLKNIYSFNNLILEGRKLIKKITEERLKPINIKIISHINAPIEWREKNLYKEDSMAI
jgi:hypothetical protein